MKRAELSRRARQDLLSATNWIAKDNWTAAQSFREAVATLSRQLVSFPEMGVVRPEIANQHYRFMVVPGFPFIVVYDPARVPPVILRVIHAARDLPEVLRDL